MTLGVSTDHWTKRGAKKHLDYVNVGRTNTNWSLVKLEGRKFFQKRYRVQYVRPSNY